MPSLTRLLAAAALLCLTTPALAEDETCAEPTLTQILPAPDAKDVPTNARVLLELTGAPACLPDALDVRLRVGAEPVPFTARSWETPTGRMYAVEPIRRLAGDAEHVVEVTGLAADGRGTFARFGTNGAWLRPSREQPRLRVLDARREGGRYTFEVEVGPSSEVGAYDLIHLALESRVGGEVGETESDFAVAVRPDPDGWSTVVSFTTEGPGADTACVVARQQDVAGQWSPSARDCAPVAAKAQDEGAGGCVAVPGATPVSPATLLPLLLPVFLSMRRRRAR